jgi:hypothetical protein
MTDDIAERRIPYDWAEFECPTCGAAPDTRCRAKSGRTTDAHAKRLKQTRRIVRARIEYERYGCQCSHPLTGVESRYGLSAYAITKGGIDHPHDGGDLCRCLKVSPNAPEHMRDRSPEWRVLVDHWDELKQLLAEEHPNGWAPKLYARMTTLFKAARAGEA